MIAPIPPDEAQRLEGLRDCHHLDTESEAVFDRTTRMAAPKDAEALLVENEERLRLALHAGAMGTWHWGFTDDSRLNNVDARFVELFGSDPLTFDSSPRSLLDRILPQDREKLNIAVDKAIASAGHLECEVRVTWPDGSLHWLSVLGQAFYEESGKPERMTGVVMDITARKKAEESLRLSDEILRELPDAIFVTDLEGRLLQWKGKAEQIFGFTAEEAVGQPVDLVQHSAYGNIPTSDLAKALRETGSFNGEFLCTRKDGSLVPIETIARTILGPDDKTLMFVSINRDITERRRRNEALQQARDEAQRANRAKSEFLSRMSHELRTPLNAILGFGQLLEMRDLDSREADNVRHILKAGRHLLELINEVLEIARIESGQLSLSSEPVHVGMALAAVLDIAGPLANPRRIRLVHEKAESDRHILADRQRLNQVLLNLVSNAIKYNREGGQVTLACVLVGDDRLRINVQDTGPGLRPEAVSRLFVPFERLGAEKTEVEGTGIGLALSRGLVEAMGGLIGVESIEGEGSVFWVEFSLEGSPLERLDSSDADQSDESISSPEDTRTLLYIEDNLSNLQLIEQLLARKGGIKLLSAMQGGLGLDLAMEHQPDLILLDVHLPDISGHEVLLRLRAEPATRNIPVVVLSADATPGQIQRLMDAGAYDYLTKPLDLRKFLRVLGETITR